MMRLAFGIWVLASEVGCYRHARPDAPAPAPRSDLAPMVRVPAGRFVMGDRNGEPEEYPEHELQMDAFAIDRFEVSRRAYGRCVQAKACDPPRDEGPPEVPVAGVSWFDAEAYCTWIGRRLPTEAEWEYAAKGGDLRKWPWTGAFDAARANTRSGDPFEGPAPVDAFEAGASPFGLRNMAGNVAEWVADYFDPVIYRTRASRLHPPGPERGREKVVRGGSFRDGSHLVRVAARQPRMPTEVDETVGFRCAADASDSGGT